MKLETVAQLEEAFPDLVKQIREAAIATVDVSAAIDDARAGIVDEATQAERDRVTAILEADGDNDVAMTAIKDGTPAAEVFKAFFEAEKQKRADGLQELEDEATPPQGQDDAGDIVATGAPDLQLVVKARALMVDNPGLSIDKAMEQVLAEDATLATAYRSQYAIN